MSRSKKAYKGRAVVPRPGGPMRDRKREASRRAARGKVTDYER